MSRKGFTLTELLITLLIAVAIGLFTYADYSGRRSASNLSTAAQEVSVILHEAQSRTLAGDTNGNSGQGFWAVEFGNPMSSPSFFGLLFETSTAHLASGTLVGGQTRLPPLVAFATSSIGSGGVLYIYYSNGAYPPGTAIGAYATCTGFTCPTSTIAIQLAVPTVLPVISSTVVVSPTGEVSY